MTVMWSAASFSNYLLNFLNKYLEGSIFQNNYFEGIAAILAILIGSNIYKNFGKRYSFIFAFFIAFCSGLVIYSLETHKMKLPHSFLMSY